jgi:hypothetical protein
LPPSSRNSASRGPFEAREPSRWLICGTIWRSGPTTRRSRVASKTHRHPEIVANYAPQLLIPQFSAPFGDAFDRLLSASEKKFARQPDSRYPDAKYEKIYALRRQDFGGHAPEDVAKKWLSGKGGSDSAKQFADTDYLFWLLSSDSDWMPIRIKEVLLTGMKSWAVWDNDILQRDVWPRKLTDALYRERLGRPAWTRTQRELLEEAVQRAFARLGIQADAAPVAEAFIARDFVGDFYSRRTRPSVPEAKAGMRPG